MVLSGCITTYPDLHCNDFCQVSQSSESRIYQEFGEIMAYILRYVMEPYVYYVMYYSSSSSSLPSNLRISPTSHCR